MSSGTYRQAIQPAQAGQRDQARQLFWQVVQADPDNEAVWLWLASVVSDQEEYRRVLNEILRINPHNDDAYATITVPEAQYERLEDDIETMIKTAKAVPGK